MPSLINQENAPRLQLVFLNGCETAELGYQVGLGVGFRVGVGLGYPNPHRTPHPKPSANPNPNPHPNPNRIPQPGRDRDAVRDGHLLRLTLE